MTDALRHRGPDGQGTWNNPGESLFFGHRRLAVIDLSPAAAQPMHLGNRYTIVYNGEIYNYMELKAQLQQEGASFSTGSDTEVILQGFHYWGASLVHQLDGMFAFAIWDEQEKTLFLARDRFGEKPLFYHFDGEGRFHFASEMKAFWAAGVSRLPDPAAVTFFLATGKSNPALSAENTFYQQLYQVPPASYCSVRKGNDALLLERTIYWDIDKQVTWKGTDADAVQQFSQLLEDSVYKRLRADVPCGSSLSGGVDSGSIAFFMSQLMQQPYSGFSAVFPGYEKDESVSIAALREQLAINSVLVHPDANELNDQLDGMLYHQEEPVGSASVFAQYLVYAAARKTGVTVLLDGQGADELLGGYESTTHWYLQELWRKDKTAAREAVKRFRNNGWRGPWGWKNYMAAWFPAAAQNALIRKEKHTITATPFLHPDLETDFPYEVLYKPLVTGLNDLLYDELTRSRLPELLRYADRNSMAFGREIRLPFLQPDLVSFTFSLPASLKVRDGYRKWILRQAMHQKLPDKIVWQVGKIGFEPPQASWMQHSLIRDRIRESRKKLVEKGWLTSKVLDAPFQPATAFDANNYDWRHLVLASL
ncbi:asparagine synthetase [Flavihumibacter petaseus NBRC 106054]|uniref:asparagine synthase (glutamine-hydrolyzing) n=2 Tax=Flavihumibacter TaxID=1004301 RepID=A0A0E9MXH6_9BACT|nr:asparagine synthetase [Flavihumibacter petaseus NBRC 106054]